MKLKKHFIFLAVFLFSMGASAQESAAPVYTGVLEGPIYVPSLAQQLRDGTFIAAPDNSNRVAPPRRGFRGKVVPGKGYPKAGDIDPLKVLQENTPRGRSNPPLQTFLTTQNASLDPTGAVGPSHYVAAWNWSFRIFDKSGNPLTPEAGLATLFPGNDLGDPIVFYDAAADRFVITQFDENPNGFLVAVCQGSDPVNDGWYVYNSGFSTGNFPDYTKFSVFGDVYMVTANIGGTNRVFAIQRNQMLGGNSAQIIALPLPGIATNGFYSPQAFHTTDNNLAPNGTAVPIVFLQDDAYGGIATDHLKVWSATIDWVTPGNSSMSAAQQINTTPFISVFDGGSFENLSQPSGPDIDALQGLIANQAQYRRFSGYNSAVFNFVVDTDAGGGELAGVRWYELRQTADGQPWSIFQEGTYTSPAGGKHAWNASMVMNSSGDIAMGYTGMSSAISVGLYYTGRFSSDPANTMTAGENLIGQGSGNSNTVRYADYSQMSLDPTDQSFWFISEYHNPEKRHLAAQFVLAPLGIDDNELEDSELIVVSGLNNQFEISLVTPFDGVASIAIYNTLGQTVAFNNLSKQGDRYSYSLDMSYASAGVYIIKVGDQRSDAYKTARIIVK